LKRREGSGNGRETTYHETRAMKRRRVRRNLYRGARLLGDVRAVEKGPKAIVKRTERRFLGRILGRLLRKV